MKKSERTLPRRERDAIRMALAAIVLVLALLVARDRMTGPAGSGGDDSSPASVRGTADSAAGEGYGPGYVARRNPTTRASGGRGANDDSLHVALDATLGDFPPTEEVDESGEQATIAGTGVVAGWTMDEAGQPVSGARLVATPMGADATLATDSAARVLATSTDSGAFTIEGLASGTWAVVASADGYAETPTLGVVVPDFGRGEPLRVVLPRSLTIRGRVTTTGAAPVAGATITATKQMLAINAAGEAVTRHVGLSGREESTGTGDFAITGLPPGVIRLNVGAPGFATTGVEVRLAHDTSDVGVRLEPQAAFGGSVRDVRGGPVPGAEVALATTDSPPRKLTSRTAEDGRFSFDSLGAGQEVSLRVKAPGFAPAGPLRFVTGTKQNIVVLGTGAAISGHVRHEDSGGGVPGIGVYARLAPNGPLAFRTLSRSDGAYALLGLPPGQYEVFVRDPRYVGRKLLICDAIEGKVRLRADFDVYEGLDIRGVVLEDDTRQPVPGALVSLNSSSGGVLPRDAARVARTDATGWFELSNVSEGRYLVHAEASGWISTKDSRTGAKVTASRLQPPMPVTIGMVRSGRIEGVAYFDGGTPATGALVQLFSDSGYGPQPTPFKATANSSGYFSIQGVPADDGLGLILTACTEAGMCGRTTPFSLTGLAPDIWEDVRIDVGEDLSVRVRSTGKGAVGSAVVAVSHVEFPKSPETPPWHATTDGTGAATVRNVPRGGIVITASRQGFAPAVRAIDHPGPGAVVDIELQPALSIAGIIEDDLGRALETGSIGAEPLDVDSPRAEAPIRRGGTFRIEGLRPGPHNLRVTVQRADGSQREHVFPGINASPDGALRLVMPVNGAVVGSAVTRSSRDPLPSFTAQLELLRGSDSSSIVARREFRGGEYRFDGLAPGVYRLRVEAPGYLPEDSESFAVASPDATTGPEVSLRVGGRLRMRIVDAAGGKGIRGATATVVESGETARASSDGTVVLGPLEPGLWTVVADHPEYLKAERHLVRVMAGKESNEGKVRLERGAELTGVVRDGRDRGIEGASVEVCEDGETERRTVLTDSAGKFRISGLRPGSALAVASGQVGTRRVSQSSQVILMRDKGAPVEFTLAADSRLEGRLVGPPGADVSRAIVDLYPLEPDNTPRLNERVEAESTPDGFVAEDIAEGDYLVTVRAPNGTADSSWYGVAPVRGSVSRVVVVAGSKVLAGRVLERQDGPALARQRVRLGLLTAPQSGVERLSRWWRRTARTRNDGSYIFQNLDAGNYDLGASNPNYPADVMDVISLGEDVEGRRLDMHFLPESEVVEVN